MPKTYDDDAKVSMMMPKFLSPSPSPSPSLSLSLSRARARARVLDQDSLTGADRGAKFSLSHAHNKDANKGTMHLV